MKLSIIIVNFNVKHFLALCLTSVFEAIKNVEGNCEVIVVDNDSKDGSELLIQKNFPKVNYYHLKENIGFSKANNYGLNKAKGELILFLNPDTILQEDTLKDCVRFYEKKEKIGALGIRMVDGSGKFLPESKRALPNPEVAFYKIFGLANLFPKSKKFGKYHLGHLSNFENHKVDILSGAFFLSRKDIIESVGGFDEKYFMYGEDIDLSYSIQKLGLDNYYFAESSIVHFKGESTKKGSLNYTRMFYKAMSIFSKKHFENKSANLFNFLIQLAIVFKAVLDVFINFLKRLWIPIFDGILIFAGFVFVKNLYQSSFKGSGNFFPEEILFVNLPIYLFIWITSIFFMGGYDRPIKIRNLIRGVLVGSFVIAAIYGFLPEGYRFSRILILLSTTSTLLLCIANRYFFHFLSPNYFKLDDTEKASKTVLVSQAITEGEVEKYIYNFGFDYVGLVSDTAHQNPNYLGKVVDLSKIVKAYRIKSVVFDCNSVNFSEIFKAFNKLDFKTNFSFFVSEGNILVGSKHKNYSGDTFNLAHNFDISKPAAIRNKRVFDFVICILMLLFFPITLFYTKASANFIADWLQVMIGKKTWVGYTKQNDLPKLKECLIDLSKIYADNDLHNFNQKTSELYARNYSLTKDFYFLRKYKELLVQ